VNVCCENVDYRPVHIDEIRKASSAGVVFPLTRGGGIV